MGPLALTAFTALAPVVGALHLATQVGPERFRSGDSLAQCLFGQPARDLGCALAAK